MAKASAIYSHMYRLDALKAMPWSTQPSTFGKTIQEAQLPQRNSASAAHMEGGWG